MSTPPDLSAVVFDLDGLMFNTELLYPQVGRELCRRRGKRFTDELLHQMMGRPGNVSLQIMIDYHQLHGDTVDTLTSESIDIFLPLLDSHLAPMPGCLELLDSLEAAEIPKGVATSSSPRFVTDILSRFDLGSRFEFILSAEDVVHGKPDPEIYRTAAARLNRDPQEMMVLEDSENGCRAAVRSGAFTVAVPGDHSSKHDFSGAAFEAASLLDARIYQALQLTPPATQ